MVAQSSMVGNGQVSASENEKKLLEYLTEQRQAGLTKPTLSLQESVLRGVERLLGTKFLTPTRDDLRACLEDIKQGKHSKRGKPVGEATLQVHKIYMKKFYDWFLGDGISLPVCVAWIKTHRSLAKQRKVEVLTKQEVKQVISVCVNPRDKALVALLYDSGCRIGELLTLRMQDVKFNQDGLEITVAGKTGVRSIPIVGDSIVYLKRWIDGRPAYEPSDFLFVNLHNYRRRMGYDTVQLMFRNIQSNLGWKRSLHAHLFRHTRASELASSPNGTEMALNDYMGWTPGSPMAKIYTHLNGKQQRDMKRQLVGLPVEVDEPLEKPVECPRCKETNLAGAKYCSMCSLPLQPGSVLDKHTEEGEMEALFGRIQKLMWPKVLEELQNDPAFKDKIAIRGNPWDKEEK